MNDYVQHELTELCKKCLDEALVLQTAIKHVAVTQAYVPLINKKQGVKCVSLDNKAWATSGLPYDLLLADMSWFMPVEACETLLKQALESLSPQGLLAFWVLGERSFIELKTLWQAIDDKPHGQAYIRASNLASGMQTLGFREPVVDVSRRVLTYSHPDTLINDLKAVRGLGFSQVFKGLLGRKRFAAFYDQLTKQMHKAPFKLSIECLSVTAWGDDGGHARTPEEFLVGENTMRQALKAIKRPS